MSKQPFTVTHWNPGQLTTWLDQLGLVQPMRDCPQDPRWHAEGDVWTHTRMTLAALQQQPEYTGGTQEEQFILYMAMLLHDAGKPRTTVLDGGWHAPRHSLASYHIARHILLPLELPLHVRHNILQLIRWHGAPPNWLKQPNAQNALVEMSWFTNAKLLYALARSDMLGRKCEDQQEVLDTLELWREEIIAINGYQQPYAFVNDQARVLFFAHKLSSLHFTPHFKGNFTVHLLSGLPGAGKDHYYTKALKHLPMLSRDMLVEEMEPGNSREQGHVNQAFREQVRQALVTRHDFVLNMTNLSREMRRRWLSMFRDYSARVHIHYIEPPLSQIVRQNKSRPQKDLTALLPKLCGLLDIPSLAESHAVTYVA